MRLARNELYYIILGRIIGLVIGIIASLIILFV